MREIIIIGSIVFLYANGMLPLAAVGFVIGLALGLLFMYRMGHNSQVMASLPASNRLNPVCQAIAQGFVVGFRHK